jgi:glycyl-tRNA synthetase beta chain
MSLPFLLEIGVEEVPDWMIKPALENMRELLRAILTEHNLGGSVTSTEGTPRRLVVRAEGVREAQPDEMKAVTGPPVSSGKGAAQGFARKLGASVDDLQIIPTSKGEYYGFNKHVPGRKSIDVLAETIPPLITKIYFPKTMYWTGKGGPRFIRPIRWMVCMLGDYVVRFELAGVLSGNTTRGHRVLGSDRIAVTPANYEQKLRQNGVILSAAERRKRIEDGLSDLVSEGNAVQADDALTETLVYLTEMPTPIRGKFDSAYLALPQEILTTVMRHHQRYFSVVDAEGKLAPEFIAVMNTDSDAENLVCMGNERVLRARFNDARFFWDVDLRRPLQDRLEDLKNVTFQAKLGSYHDKTVRVVDLAKEIGQSAGANVNACARAALLSKCDLTTEMVKEFTELQGVVGGLYAREASEPLEIWRAIYEHYKPVGMDDSVPSMLEGQVVALADKIDTLRGCFDIGLMPTGSRDPFALRRAAQGVVKILVEGSVRAKLSTLLGNNEPLREFMIDRVRYYLKDVRGYAYDEVNAVLASGSDDLKDIEHRMAAISAVRPTENFEPLAASFKRIQNILRQAQFEPSGRVNPGLLDAGAEADLHNEFLRLRDVVYTHRRAQDYRAALEAIASIRPKVDLFFDKVLVNAPEQRVRHNRLLLLNSLLSEFSTIADFSEISITQ